MSAQGADSAVAELEREMPRVQSTVTVTQKYWSWFNKTGRGFTITDADGEALFVVGSSQMGKHRTIEDHSGRPLYHLKRNWTSTEHAWILTDEGDEVVLSIKHSWLHPRVHMEAIPGPRRASKQIELNGSSLWGDRIEIKSADRPLGTMQCINMAPGAWSSFKITPPKWTLDVFEGADLDLIVALAICVSDAFSETRALML